MTMLIFALLLALFLNLNCQPILASDGNIFGLHLTQTSDITSAAPIINSGGGDWGWATTVIRTDQLNPQTWQEYFDNCRKFHIIPIIRLATIMENGYWKIPEYSDIDNLANFLNSLNWPTVNQHIILFNEINHSSEWGGKIDPKGFADLAVYTAQKFKTLNPNFFILGDPLDLAAAKNLPDTESAANIYREIFLYKPQYFELIDGLASHSYPNHGYIGTPNDTGQHSIRGYLWELAYLKSLGISKTYPVFITETGWPHREGESNDNHYYTVNSSAKFLINAIKIWSADSRIQAITPFIYNYPHSPFDHFSWLNSAEKIYPEYQQIIDLPKSQNHPAQITKYEVVANHLPFLIFTDTDYVGQITLKNTGQSIWGETKFCLNPQTTPNVTLDAICTNDYYVYPGQIEIFNYKIRINNNSDYRDKTFISWENLIQFEITPINNSGTLFSPKTSLKEKIVQFFQGLFI
jgi:hypothetical protein